MSIDQTITLGADILVVDDNPTDLRLLTQILTEHGYEVRPVSDGSLALSSAQTESPDLILLDFKMPEMSGYDICKALKTDGRTRHIPVIFISASDEIFDKINAFFVGGVDYITKPFQLEEVLARVETHLTLQGLQRILYQKNTLLQQEITTRKRVEESLRESEERYRRLVELSPDAIMVHQDGKLVYVNTTAVRLLAATVSGDLIGRSIVDIVHPDSQDFIEEQEQEFFGGGKSAALMEGKLVRLDGQEIAVEIAGAPITYQGTPATQIVIRDITERKQAEDLLCKLGEAVETTEVGITITDPEGQIVYINPADAKMHGYTVEELIGQPSNIFTTPELRESPPRMKNDIQEVSRWKRERLNVRKDGSVFPVTLISNPIYDKTGYLIGIVTVCEDITARKQAEKLLQESEQRYRSIFKHATIGIFQATLDGKFITANPALARMLGYTSTRELIATVTSIADQLYVEPRHWHEITDIIQVIQEKTTVETRFRCKDGREIIVNINIWAVRNQDGNVLYFEGLIEDITERKQTERILREQEILSRGIAGAMTRLLVSADFESSIKETLEILGFVTGVSRIYIFKTHHHPETGKALMSQRFTWAQDLVDVQMNIPDLQNLPYNKGLKRWYKILSSNNAFWGLVRKFPQSEQEMLKSRGTISLLVAPITVHERFWGFIEFDDCQTERQWNEEEKSILLAMARSIGGAIARQHAATELITANDKLKETLERLKRTEK
jgi:PAS domain S-box-containing protein